ncbi:lyase family protein [Pseudoalteromonas sp. YIC-656]|uniref:lyase family protein n=1 Tax=Pseudoalteromonas pernae TaxID=3118054 RepID=UPI003242AEF1
MNNGFLGAETRFKKPPSETLVNSAFAYELECSRYVMKGLSIADLAHVMNLSQDEVIQPDVALALIKGLQDVHLRGTDVIPLDPAVGDSYNNRDKYLQSELPALSGYIHIGRARREASTLAWQLCCREKMLNVHKALTKLVATFNDVIAQHHTTYMADFTYLQHAQPTTLAHYLQGFQMPLTRDLDRVENALKMVNQSPACSGSVNGSQIPMDRYRIAELLEFPAVIEHTRDAMWAPDMCLDLMLPLNSIMTTLDRVSEEFIVWNSAEFAYLELDDAHTRTSVIMPQKKNPYGLAYIRGQARALNGTMMSLLSCNQTISGQPDNRLYAYGELPRAMDYVEQCLALFEETLRAARFDKSQLAKAAADNFIISTDLCDMLVKHAGLDNRSAHKIIARAVRNALENAQTKLTLSAVMTAASQLAIVLPAISQDVFDEVSNIPSLIMLRQGVGSAHPDSVKSLASKTARRISLAEDYANELNFEHFEQRFLNRVNEYIAFLEGQCER